MSTRQQGIAGLPGRSAQLQTEVVSRRGTPSNPGGMPPSAPSIGIPPNPVLASEPCALCAEICSCTENFEGRSPEFAQTEAGGGVDVLPESPRQGVS